MKTSTSTSFVYFRAEKACVGCSLVSDGIAEMQVILRHSFFFPIFAYGKTSKFLSCKNCNDIAKKVTGGWLKSSIKVVR